MFVTLLGANKLHVAVFIDSSTKDTGAVKRLRVTVNLPRNGLVEISEFTGGGDAYVEDLFDRNSYLKLANRAYVTEPSQPITLAGLSPASLGSHAIESSMAGSSPRPEFREVLLPDLAERPREAQPAPVATEQARVQPAGVVLPRDRRGQDCHVIQVALARVR
jgi:hypothetical protein